MSKKSIMKRALLTSAGAAGIVLATGAAHAQDAAPKPTSTTAVDEANDADIIVTGIRGSIKRAQDLKRLAPTVIESITFEDLGKFSDTNVADSLQRVPGVQIERNDSGDTGDRAAIRGLGSQYVQVTVNDRTLVSFGNAGRDPASIRSFNFDQVPSEVIGGLTVYKAPIAEIVEPGIGGTINISTVRPLDYKTASGSSFFGSATVRGEVDSIQKDLRPRYSAGLGGKFFGDTLGIYVSGLISDTRTRTDTIAQTNFVIPTLSVASATPGGAATVFKNVIGNNGDEIYTNSFLRNRRTGSIGVQWKPTSTLDVYADFTYNQYSNSQERQNISLGTNGGQLYANPQAGDVTIEDGVITGFRSVRPGVSRYSNQNQFSTNDSRQLYGGINAKWTSGPLELAFDYGHSEVKYDNGLAVIYAQDVPLSYVRTQVNGLPNFQFNAPITGIAGIANYFYNVRRQLDTDRNSFRFDTSYRFSDSLRFKAGVRYEKTHLDSRSGEAFYLLPASLGGGNLATDFGPGRDQTFTNAEIAALDGLAFPTGKTFSVFPNLGIPALPASSYSGFCSIATVLCGANIRNGSLYNGAFPTSGTPPVGDDSNDLPLSPNNTVLADERNLAFYASLDGKGQFAGIPFEGNLGARAVNIRLRSTGFAAVLNRQATGAVVPGKPDILTPFTDTNDYWRVLPNLNINAHPASNINLRLSIAKSLTLPEYADTTPRGVLTIIDPTSPQYDVNLHPNTANFGNTKLNPITAWNFDVTAEYYTASKGSIVLSLFYKDVSNLILNTLVNNFSIAGQNVTFQFTGPANIAKANVKGFEIGANQPFTFLPAPLDGFGLQANYTFVDSKIESNLPEAQYGFPGASKHNANVVFYYEKYGLGARLGYTYRSRNLLGIGGQLPLIEEPISNLDLNVSYAITKNIEINGSILNLTQASRRNYSSNPLALAQYYNRPSLYTFGVRASF